MENDKLKEMGFAFHTLGLAMEVLADSFKPFRDYWVTQLDKRQRRRRKRIYKKRGQK